MLIALVLLHSSSGLVAAEEAVFVEKDTAHCVREIGNKWTGKEGTVTCGGTGNFLVAGKALGAGDFQIRARLSLERDHDRTRTDARNNTMQHPDDIQRVGADVKKKLVGQGEW